MEDGPQRIELSFAKRIGRDFRTGTKGQSRCDRDSVAERSDRQVDECERWSNHYGAGREGDCSFAGIWRPRQEGRAQQSSEALGRKALTTESTEFHKVRHRGV